MPDLETSLAHGRVSLQRASRHQAKVAEIIIMTIIITSAIISPVVDGGQEYKEGRATQRLVHTINIWCLFCVHETLSFFSSRTPEEEDEEEEASTCSS